MDEARFKQGTYIKPKRKYTTNETAEGPHHTVKNQRLKQSNNSSSEQTKIQYHKYGLYMVNVLRYLMTELYMVQMPDHVA